MLQGLDNPIRPICLICPVVRIFSPSAFMKPTSFALFRLILTLCLPIACRAQAVQSIPSILQPYVDQHTMSGAVTLVANSNQILSLDAVGYADIASSKAMTADALFWIASMSKAMTCSALMMLVDEGKVSVDDPVQNYLPEFAGQLVYSDTTQTTTHAPPHPMLIREIMSHTAGFHGSYPVDSPTGDLYPLSQLVGSYAAATLDTDPGTAYQYANPGINTAGRIVEVVSGMPYDQFMSQRLFVPLGMVDTTFWPTTAQLQRLATSYQTVNNNLAAYYINQLYYPLSDTTHRFAMPAGGLFSTASDVAKFCQMFLNGGVYNGVRYLSKAAVQRMTSKQTGDLVSTNYGFGWGVSGADFSHGGAYKTNMDVNLQLGLVRIFMVQQGSDWPNNGNNILGSFMTGASNLLIGSTLPSPAIPTTGATVMQDNFSYVASSISGHAPTTGTGAWTAWYGSNCTVSTDGTNARFILQSGTDPANYNAVVSYPFTPAASTLYSLSFTLNFINPVSRDAWAGVGFSSNTNAGNDANNIEGPWFLIRQPASSTSDGSASGFHGNATTPHTVGSWSVYAAMYPTVLATITLNTQTNEAKFFLGGVYQGGVTLSSPSIHYLFFQAFRISDILSIKNVTLTQMSLSPWAKSFFPVAQQNNPAFVSGTAIPQNDGVCNLLKYFCDINPATPMADADRAALPAVHSEYVGSTRYLTLTYRKNAWAGGLVPNVQVSTGLTANSWQTVTPDLTTTISTDYLTGDQTIKSGVNVTGTQRKFIRLQITGT